MDQVVERFRYTRHQTPRGALADAETRDKLYMFKNVSGLRLTYQIRLMAFRASQENKKLVLRVPKGCKLDRALSAFIKDLRPTVQIERV